MEWPWQRRKRERAERKAAEAKAEAQRAHDAWNPAVKHCMAIIKEATKDHPERSNFVSTDATYWSQVSKWSTADFRKSLRSQLRLSKLGHLPISLQRKYVGPGENGPVTGVYFDREIAQEQKRLIKWLVTHPRETLELIKDVVDVNQQFEDARLFR